MAHLEEAVRVGVVEERSEVGGVRYRFSHAFFRQNLYEEISAARRIRFHQQVGAALEGLYAGRINFADDAVARRLSIGSGGSAAIYTQKGKATHVISKVAIRMKKWLLYVMPSVEKSS